MGKNLAGPRRLAQYGRYCESARTGRYETAPNCGAHCSVDAVVRIILALCIAIAGLWYVSRRYQARLRAVGHSNAVGQGSVMAARPLCCRGDLILRTPNQVAAVTTPSLCPWRLQPLFGRRTTRFVSLPGKTRPPTYEQNRWPISAGARVVYSLSHSSTSKNGGMLGVLLTGISQFRRGEVFVPTLCMLGAEKQIHCRHNK